MRWQNFAFDADLKRKHAEMFFAGEHEFKFTTFVGPRNDGRTYLSSPAVTLNSYLITAGP